MASRRSGITAAVSVSILLILAAGIVVCFPGCHRRAAVTQPGALSQIAMIDPRIGWALTRKAQVFRTTDGGATWSNVSFFQASASSQEVPAISACFLDGQTAFVTVNAGTANQPQIVVYRTRDRGTTWKRTLITATLAWERDDVGGLAISFPDASDGYVMIEGTPGAGQMAKSLYRTTDGGATFAFVGDITSRTDQAGTIDGIAGYPTGMTFSTPNKGFITCSYGAYTFVLMFRTTDAGKNWKLWSVPVPAAYQKLNPAQDFYADAYPPIFFGKQKNEGTLMLDYVRNGNHLMQSYQTTDGGGTWTLGIVSGSPDIRAASFTSTAVGWGLDENGKLFTTTDSGVTWTAVTAGTP